MTDDMILDIPENNIGVNCIGIDHGYLPIEDAPLLHTMGARRGNCFQYLKHRSPAP